MSKEKHEDSQILEISLYMHIATMIQIVNYEAHSDSIAAVWYKLHEF